MKMTAAPAFICSHVFAESASVLLVLHDDGDWQFLCGGDHADDEVPVVVGMNHLLDADPSIETVLDLPIGWEAERKSMRAPWERRRI